ncbi:MAG: hypothetical protein QOH82_1830 [Mycobacterium sp.]|nr:hypothetical protein [Mycobacterium sp.]
MTPSGRVVVVVGPPRSGVDSIIAALRTHLLDVAVVGADGLAPDCAPDAVLGVVSAVAPMTMSDWALIERAAARTHLVIGVLSKIDAHLGWREVMEADRLLAASADLGREPLPWVGVAAAPDLGEPRLGELLDVLRVHLADPDLDRRNQLQNKEFRLRAERARARPPTVSRADALALRSALQRTRLGLLRYVRERSSQLRAVLRDAASAVPAGGSSAFEALVKVEADRFLAELDEEITGAVQAAAIELGLADRVGRPFEPARQDPPDVSRSPSSSRRLEGRLMTVLGVGFGLGIALGSSRLLAGLAPGLSLAGLAAGSVAGLALVVWVVRVRGLLHDRALLDRWVTEVGATLRWHGEAMVADRLLVAESEWVRVRPRGPLERDSNRGREVGFRHPQWDHAVVTDQYEW